MLFRRLEGHKVSPYSNNEPTLFLNSPLIGYTEINVVSVCCW